MSNDGIDRGLLPEVVIVVNGALEMSPGKLVGQAYQAAMRQLIEIAENPTLEDETEDAYSKWIKDGTRTIVKAAKTQTMFERVCNDVPGYVMVDEGHTEVEPNTATVFVSYPFLHKDRPAILDKKVSML